jgi:U6 snRNA phosphodiesterase
LKLADLYWVSNLEKTRWFLALQLQRPEGDELNRLLAACNSTVADYSQPPLYASPRSASQQSPKGNGRVRKLGHSKMSAPPKNEEILDFSISFHISIGWALEWPSSYVLDTTRALINDEVFELLQQAPVKVDALKVKVGNVVTSISLAPKVADGKSIFGA